MKNKDYATFGVGGKKGVLWKMCKWRIDRSFPLFFVTAPAVSAKVKGGVWLHFEPKFVTDCKAHKTPAILCIFIEFFMQIDQPRV